MAIVLAGSLLLTILAVLSTVSAGLTVQYGSTLEEIRLQHRVDPAILAAGARDAEAAANWFESARNHTDAAAFRIALAEAGQPQGRKPEQLVVAALAAAPAQPYNWARLAYLKLGAGDVPGAVAAWKMSILTGRYVPVLMRPRMILGMDLMISHDPELAAQLSDQLLVYGQSLPNELAAVARALGAEPFVRATLASAPDELKAFNEGTDKLVNLKVWQMRRPVLTPAPTPTPTAAPRVGTK